VQNPETREWLPRRHRDKARVCPNPVLDETFSVAAETGRRSRPPMALFAGRLVAWKGMFLALRALAELPDWHLVVCGKGRDEKRLRRLAGRLGVADRVEFRGFVPRPELLRLMREEAAVLLFPSLHEEAGWVVVEARACGLPVVCIDRGGPPVLGGEGVAATTIGATVGALVRRLEDVIGRVGETPGEAEAAGRWTLDARRNELRAILREADLPVRHGGLPR
jgi:glycosyltransferase involved in cell wall biosynthesis